MTDGTKKGAIVPPRLLSGFRDYLPQQALLRQHVLSILREVFESHGFEPFDTPALEHASTLTGKYGEDEKLLYRFQDHGGREVGLRYDLTVPLARVAASRANDLVLPFKRYHMALVWRGDRPQRGRFREFFQCDVDTIGSPSMLADAEAVATAVDALRRLGFREFKVQINHRQVISGLAQLAGVPEEQAGQVYRGVDKIEKIGPAGVRDDLLGRGISGEAADRVLELVTMTGSDDAILAQLRARAGVFPDILAAIRDLEQLLLYLPGLGVPREHYGLHLALARGLDYYTGPVFEIKVEEPKVGSIGGGGRYDRLIGAFSGRDVPATGFSLGVERILEVIQEFDLLPVPASAAQVLVTIVRERDATGPEADAPVLEALELATTLRAGGIRTDVYLNERRGLRDQLTYANRKSIPLVLIRGETERSRGEVKLKDLRSGVERDIAAGRVLPEVRALLGMTAK